MNPDVFSTKNKRVGKRVAAILLVAIIFAPFFTVLFLPQTIEAVVDDVIDMAIFDTAGIAGSEAASVGQAVYSVPTSNIVSETHTAILAAKAINDTVKDGFWKGVALGIVKIFINRLTNSMVQWIRSGYQGRPGFLASPEAFFQDLGNQATGVFISEMGLNEVMCEPWRFGATFGLVFQKPYLLKAKCTLLDAQANFQNMSQNFMAAGWQGFLDITVKQENNPYGAFLNAQSELATKIGKAEEKQKSDLSFGRGFFSVTKKGECVQHEYDIDPETGTDLCTKYAPDINVTPGSYIADVTSGVGLSSLRQAELAKDIDSALAIIAGEMIMQAINPNRGFVGFDTVTLEEDATRALAGASDSLSDIVSGKINDLIASQNKKNSSTALIQIIYPIYDTLIGETSATDGSGAIIIDLDDITGNGSCLALEYASGEDTSGTAAKIEEFIATLGTINNKEDGIGAEIPLMATALGTLNGWYGEITAATPPQPARITEISNALDGVKFPSSASATSEYNDLVSKRDSAQTALDECQGT